MNQKSTFDPKIRVRPLTVKEMSEFAYVNFENEDVMKYINTLVVKCSSLPALQNNIVGHLIIDIIQFSDIEISKDTEEKLKRISNLANTYPAIFNDNLEKPELRAEIKELYISLVEEIQPNAKEFRKAKLKIYQNLGIQPSELDALPYWEFKFYLKNIK